MTSSEEVGAAPSGEVITISDMRRETSEDFAQKVGHEPSSLDHGRGVDHSLTYTRRSLRNLPHRQRLRRLFSIMDALRSSKFLNTEVLYADVGCSNGYLTDLIARRYKFSDAHGFDHDWVNLRTAAKLYPLVRFDYIDLNSEQRLGTFDFVTCFETLEHVGRLETAVDNLLHMVRPGGHLLITVPIEVGFWGTLKFLVKTGLYRDSLEELPHEKIGRVYLLSLLFGRDLSRFRDERQGWGTHFGFDYRLIDRHLARCGIDFTARNVFTTRYYTVQVPR